MPVRNREKLLAAVVGLMLAVLLFWYVVPMLLQGNSRERRQRDVLAADVHKKQSRVEQAEKAFAQLKQWERRCLPTDRKAAESSYQSWLAQLVERFKFGKPSVQSAEGHSVQGIYTPLTFTVRGQATLDQVVQFLYAFYSAGHLQQVRHFTLKPREDAKVWEAPKEVDVSITIEALILPGADRTEQLTTESGTRLRTSTLDSYEKAIAQRNPFVPYRLLARRPSGPPPAFDASKYAFFTGSTSVNGRAQAWFVDRMGNQVYQLHEGDPLEIGTFKGKITRVGTWAVEIEMDDGAHHLFSLGRSLQEPLDDPKLSGEAAPDGGEKTAASPDKSKDVPPKSPENLRPTKSGRSHGPSPITSAGG